MQFGLYFRNPSSSQKIHNIGMFNSTRDLEIWLNKTSPQFQEFKIDLISETENNKRLQEVKIYLRGYKRILIQKENQKSFFLNTT